MGKNIIMPYRNKTTGEIISDEEYNEKFKKEPSLPSKVLGGAFRVASIPATIATTLAKTTGEVIGGLSTGLPEGRQEILKSVREAGREITRIPSEIGKGFEEGIFGESKMMTPSKALGLSGTPGLLTDILGDPVNIVMFGLTPKNVLSVVNKSDKLIADIGIRVYQELTKLSKKDVKQYQTLGLMFNEAVKETAETTGRSLFHYGIKGNFEGMIKTMNQKIPILKNRLDGLAKESKEIIDLSFVKENLNNLAKQLEKINETEMAKTIRIIGDNLIKKGEKISIEEALSLKRAYDVARKTASGALSESRSIQNQVYKTIADGLRSRLNKIPEIGTINDELETYLDVLPIFAKKLGESGMKLFPFKVGGGFPFVYLNLGEFPALKTGLTQTLKVISQITKNPLSEVERGLKILMPSFIKNITNSKD